VQRAVRAAAATTGAVLAALAWTLPAGIAVAAASALGLASGLGHRSLRVVSMLLVAGWAVLAAPFQSLVAAAMLLGLAAVNVLLVLADLARAPRRLRGLAVGLAAVEAVVVGWMLTHIG
jgi:hypothetical protein